METTKKRSSSTSVWALVILLLIIAVGAAIAVYAFRGGPEQQAAEQAQESGQVTITTTGFEPATILIKKGQTVTWVNQDGKPHKVTGVNGEINSDEELNQGDSYSQTFDTPGTYEYNSGVGETSFNGVVVVE